MKKRTIAIMCSLVLSVGLIGCGGNKNAQDTNNKEASSATEQKEVDKNKPPINMDDVKLDITTGQTDSKGKHYIDVTLTNNTKLSIKYCNITIFNKDTGEETYLTFAKTIKPGETSEKASTFAPKSGKLDDVEILRYNMTLEGENGEEISLKYDTRLKQYQWKSN